jgi:hypothetical protein
MDLEEYVRLINSTLPVEYHVSTDLCAEDTARALEQLLGITLEDHHTVIQRIQQLTTTSRFRTLLLLQEKEEEEHAADYSMSSNSSTKQLPHPHPHPPSNKSRATATAALFLGLGLVLAVLAAITNYTANTIVHNNLHDILPINTRNLHLYAHYNSIISFYIYDYINIRNASNGTSIALKQTGPFILYNSYHWYNVSISDYTVRYMKYLCHSSFYAVYFNNRKFSCKCPC